MGQTTETSKKPDAKELSMEERRALKKEKDEKAIFSSHILARKHGFIYLNRDDPLRMYCSQISPELLFHHARLEEESVHRILSKERNIPDIWDEIWPMLKKWNHMCVSRAGIERLYREFSTDEQRLDDLQNDGDLWYVIRDEKTGNRVKKVIIPILWEICVDEVNYLDELIRTHEAFMETADHVEEQVVTAKDIPTNVGYVTPPGDAFGKRLHVAYVQGVTGANIKGFCSRVKIPGVTICWGINGKTVRLYSKADSDICSIVSVMPAVYYFKLY